ncbi:hypothetical protein IC006_0043 [Sulfuracidifex tepidarius]|uniref:Uncharacterized protein n=1 Tax=Sulfuracidifex tepidarius TaxID=1294262 RepID=A0A510DRE7_9CREN|nr:hypothetical protein [Sulfuracidifex tepidarius]BBG22759.1 hypothetical protein IC006_0043 [Sulfuracidifex tepidarius]
MNVGLSLILLAIFLVSLTPTALSQGSSYILDATIADGTSLFSYTYNYTVEKTNPLVYSLQVSTPNGSPVLNGTYTDSSRCFPNYIPIDGENVSMKYKGQVQIEGNTYQEFVGDAYVRGEQIPIDAYFLGGVLFKLNGSYENITINMINISVNTQSKPSSSIDYVPIIVVAVVIVLAIVIMIKLGKI